ncbi:pyrroloquinoline quinone precursor peptide PqqA [Candidatus Sumerlaeota bacterium]|nr:pyrroloquinoline quinone precursor peptide PqqA [Candidatus Sumerlaeota bacterium]MBI3735864.1 pyrroloquinoline quinone precursor peptide PqqA [Candidatus Sumerlaeota bacterium]
MKWIKPEFKEISLCMEVTAYVNTDERTAKAAEPRSDKSAESAREPRNVQAN